MRRVTWVLCCLVLAGQGLAADWPQTRGPGRNGVSGESSQYPKGWPPARLWNAKVGYGCTSPIMADGRLYVMGFSGAKGHSGANPLGTDVIRCFEARSGKLLWQQSYPCTYQGRFRKGDESWYGGPSGTPAIDTTTGYLYSLSIDGDLQCWDTRQKGKQVWRVNLYEKYGVKQRPVSSAGHRDYGYTGSPLVYEDQVVIEVGAPSGSLMAFDKKTGKQVWASKYNKPAGHSGGPVVLRIAGRDAFAWLGLFDVVVADARGRTIATEPWITAYSTNIPTPAPLGDRLVVTTGYNRKQTRLFKVAGGKLQTVWQSKYHSTVTSPLVFNNRVYTIKKNVIEAMRLNDGQRLWRGKKFEHGSVIALDGDDKIIACGSGSMALIDATDSYKELSRIDRLYSGIAFPAVGFSNGIIAAKDREGNLAVLSVNPGDRKAGSPKHVKMPKPPSPPPAPEVKQVDEAPMPKMTGEWPGNRDGLVFVWPSKRAKGDALEPRGNAGFTKQGRMHLRGGAFLADAKAQQLLRECKQSNQLGIEAMITVDNVSQGGPARIISFSLDPYKRIFTVGQSNQRLVMRLRTPRTGANGSNPETTLCQVKAGRAHHLIVSYQPGRLTCYLDGKPVLATDRVQGDFSNWEQQHLLFGNEWTDDRPWHGMLSHVAIHSRAIGAKEAAARYRLATGEKAGSAPVVERAKPQAAVMPLAASRKLKVTDGVVVQGRDCFRIDTPTATWFYDKQGAGFVSLLDIDGNDWISWRPKGGAAGNYRGIPNLGRKKGGFHPGPADCTSRVVEQNDKQVVIDSQSGDRKWATRWIIRADHAQLTVLKTDAPYWFLYEGTPGGRLDEMNSVCIRSDGKRTTLQRKWDGDLPGHPGRPGDPGAGAEWVCFTDMVAEHGLLLVQHEDDNHTDSYWPMQHNMTVFGFGRLGMKQFLRQTPAVFSVAMVLDPDEVTLRAKVKQLLRQ